MNKRSIVPGVLLGSLIVIAAAGAIHAATPAFIKFDGVDGEATDNEHKGWIALGSFTQPVRETGAATGAARRRGDVVLEDIVVVKQVDKSSPKLAEAVCKGKVFPKVELHVSTSDPGSPRPTYHAYELTNVRVTSYSVHAGGSSGDPLPSEEISLNFEEVKVTYGKAMTKGKGHVETTWKIEEGE